MGYDIRFDASGAPNNASPSECKKQRAQFKKNQGKRNYNEASFRHLKERFNFNKIK